MRTVERLDLSRKDHRLFMYDLAVLCKEDFLNDVDNDIVLMMNEYERALDAGQAVAFVGKQGEEKAGIVWVELGRYGVGRIRAGMMPEFRRGTTAMHFLRQFIDFCFTTLNVRKLDAELTMGARKPDGGYEPMPRGTKAAEKMLRRFGFRKEGLIPEAMLKDGKPRDTLLFGYTRNQYKGRKANEQKKQRV